MTAVHDVRPAAGPRGAPDLAAFRTELGAVLAQIAPSAAQRERDRELPHTQVQAVARTGLLRLRLPVQDGGLGGTVRDLVEAVVDIARADSNVAHALRPSVLTSDGVARSGRDDPRRAELLERVLRGDLFSGTRNERGGAAGATSTTLRPDADGDGFVLTGEKFYSTGGLFADWFSADALLEDGTRVNVTVPTDRAGVERLDDFDAVGQRLTASGTTRLHDVRVSADEVAPVPPVTAATYGSLAHLHIAAVEAGIAAAVLDDAVDFAQRHARPIKHSSADRAVDDPYVREVVGRIAAHAFTARAVVLAAAEALDADTGTAGAIAVAQAVVAVAQETLAAATLLFDVGNGSAIRAEFGFDRHWRNARTAVNHNPRTWKAAAVGTYLMTGERPPANGLF